MVHACGFSSKLPASVSDPALQVFPNNDPAHTLRFIVINEEVIFVQNERLNLTVPGGDPSLYTLHDTPLDGFLNLHTSHLSNYA